MSQIHKKIGTIGIGFFANTTVNTIFDYVLYPTALLYFGITIGGIIMTGASLVINFLMILLYSINDTDWFGFEQLRLEKDKEEGNRLIKWFFKLGHWPTYFFLSLYDPFLGFVFAKGKRKSHKHFSLHDWIIFIVAHVIGNAGWIVVVSGAIKIIKILIF